MMTYFYSLFKNPKKIKDSEGLADKPIDPETGECYDCFQHHDDAWYTFDYLLRTTNYTASRLSIYSNELGVKIGHKRGHICGQACTSSFLSMVDELDSINPDDVSPELRAVLESLWQLRASCALGDIIVFG